MVGGSRRWGSQCAYDFYSPSASSSSSSSPAAAAAAATVSGRFFSPDFPQHYPPDTRCQYAFFGQPSQRVNITFHNFSLAQIHGRQVLLVV